MKLILESADNKYVFPDFTPDITFLVLFNLSNRLMTMEFYNFFLMKISFNYKINNYQRVHLIVCKLQTLLPSQPGQVKTLGTQMGYPIGVLIWVLQESNQLRLLTMIKVINI